MWFDQEQADCRLALIFFMVAIILAAPAVCLSNEGDAIAAKEPVDFVDPAVL